MAYEQREAKNSGNSVGHPDRGGDHHIPGRNSDNTC